jgi:RTX calcium-binding nonapeptide repeat (4 copies)
MTQHATYVLAVLGFAGLFSLGVVVGVAPGAPAAGGLTYVRITGTKGNDTIRGTARAAAIYGLAGKDTTYGRGGNDRINGGPGKDKVFCGAGIDRVQADRLDVVARGCEIVTRASVTVVRTTTISTTTKATATPTAPTATRVTTTTPTTTRATTTTPTTTTSPAPPLVVPFGVSYTWAPERWARVTTATDGAQAAASCKAKVGSNYSYFVYAATATQGGTGNVNVTANSFCYGAQQPFLPLNRLVIQLGPYNRTPGLPNPYPRLWFALG